MLRNMLGIGMLLKTPSYQRDQTAAESGQSVSDNPLTEGSKLGFA